MSWVSQRQQTLETASSEMGTAKESGASQKKSIGMVTGEAENMRLQLVTEGPAEPKSNAKVLWCKHLPPSQEREESTMWVHLYKTAEKN